MGRPRAGHGWTAFHRGDKTIWLLADCHGRWVTTGEAKKWQRCAKCRRPEHIMPENSGLCTSCFYYKSGRGGTWFWSRQEDYLFPYNIGRRITRNMNWDRRPLSDPKVDWRAYLRTQPMQGH